MCNFWESAETICSGVGFSHYDTIHLCWLAVFVLSLLFGSLLYRKLSNKGRNIMKRTLGLAMIVMEALKILLLACTGRFRWGYLPLHLCGINIFLILVHAWKSSRLLDNFLYLVCIPGALAALLFPNWTELPLGNIYHIHSFVVHILLVMYPFVQAVNGSLQLELRSVWKSLSLLVVMAIPIYGLNLLLDTNFMFLMYADAGNPLAVFEKMWGSHLLGYPVIIAAVVIVMYLPVLLLRRKNKG